MNIRLAVLALALLLAACAADAVSPADWQGMDREHKVLYVKTLIGAEKVKDAKGGTGREFARPAEEYVAGIDAAYARGDQRPVHEIFSELEPAR